MRKFLSSELGFFIILTTILMSISLAPTVKRYLTTPPDRVFDGLEYYSDDYSIYVSNMLQGQNGRWTLLDKHTTEPHQGTIIHDEYLLWGKFAGLFHVDQIKAYHLARLTFGIILLAVIYLLLKEIFSTNKFKRQLAFFLITFSTGFPIFSASPSNNPLSFLGLSVKERLDWITEMDVFYRFVALPHYLLGNIFFVGGLICFLKYLKSNGQRPTANHYLLFGAFSALMIALIHPVALVVFLGMLGIYLLFSNLSKIISANEFKIFSKENLFFLVCLSVSSPVMLYYKYLFTIPPWTHMAAWEAVTQYFIPLSDFAGAIGPTFFLGIIGFFAILFCLVIPSDRRKSRDLFQINSVEKDSSAPPRLRSGSVGMTILTALILFSWILSYFLLIYYSYPFLRISQVRFTQVFIFIPFGILAAEGVFVLTRFFTTVIPDLIGNDMRNKSAYFLVLLIFFILLNALPVYYVSFLSKWYSYDNFSEIAYPYAKIVAGYNWLAKNANPNDRVLTAFLAGTQIPYLSGNTVYVGHLWATLNRVQKEKLQYKFLGNKMTETEARTFFQKNSLKYFFDDYQAASYGIRPQNYPFLRPVFSNNMVTIYLAKY